MWPFSAWAMKSMHYNPFHGRIAEILAYYKKNLVEKRNDEVRFQNGCKNMAVLRTRNEKHAFITLICLQIAYISRFARSRG